MTSLPPGLSSLVQAELRELCADPRLARSPQLVRLLRHVVLRHLDGDAPALREAVIALEVFGRDAQTYDTQADAIVRVAATRLRAHLARHYAQPRAGRRVRIVLPTGRYVPEYVVETPAAVARRAGAAAAIDEVRLLLSPCSAEALGEAHARAERLVAGNPESAPAWACLAAAAEARARICGVTPALLVRLREAAERAIALDPADPDALHAAGLACMRLARRHRAAAAHFARALRRAPHHTPARLAHAQALAAVGAADRALHELDIALSYAPLGRDVRLARARHLALRQRYDEALAEWTLLAAGAAGDVLADTGPGHALARSGRLAAAREHARTALARHPGRAEPLVLAATVDVLDGRDAEARDREAVLAARFPSAGRAAAPVLHALRGDAGATLAALQAALDDDWDLPWTLLDRCFAFIADDTRFLAVAREAGVPAVALPRSTRLV